jgi:hypothetical protein
MIPAVLSFYLGRNSLHTSWSAVGFYSDTSEFIFTWPFFFYLCRVPSYPVDFYLPVDAFPGGYVYLHLSTLLSVGFSFSLLPGALFNRMSGSVQSSLNALFLGVLDSYCTDLCASCFCCERSPWANSWNGAIFSFIKAVC